MSSSDAKRRPRSGFRLISCRTPSTSPFGVFIGTTSMDFVRCLVSPSNVRSIVNGDAEVGAEASGRLTT